MSHKILEPKASHTYTKTLYLPAHREYLTKRNRSLYGAGHFEDSLTTRRMVSQGNPK